MQTQVTSSSQKWPKIVVDKLWRRLLPKPSHLCHEKQLIIAQICTPHDKVSTDIRLFDVLTYGKIWVYMKDLADHKARGYPWVKTWASEMGCKWYVGINHKVINLVAKEVSWLQGLSTSFQWSTNMVKDAFWGTIGSSCLANFMALS